MLPAVIEQRIEELVKEEREAINVLHRYATGARLLMPEAVVALREILLHCRESLSPLMAVTHTASETTIEEGSDEDV